MSVVARGMMIISFEEDNFKDDNLFLERVHLMQKAGIRDTSLSHNCPMTLALLA